LREMRADDVLQGAVSALDENLRRRPGAWHAWSEAHLYFER
jgi:hypothetical protein